MGWTALHNVALPSEHVVSRGREVWGRPWPLCPGAEVTLLLTDHTARRSMWVGHGFLWPLTGSLTPPIFRVRISFSEWWEASQGFHTLWQDLTCVVKSFLRLEPELALKWRSWAQGAEWAVACVGVGYCSHLIFVVSSCNFHFAGSAKK